MGKKLHMDEANEGSAVARAAEVLRGGGVIVFPTDSVYGIGCLATPGNPGFGRIFEIKHRERSQTLPWLVGAASDLVRYGWEVPEWGMRLARKFWPGALTIVVKASPAVPPEYLRDDGTVALRMPGSRFVLDLIARVGVPIANTSANTHGRDAAISGETVEARIVREADLTIDAGAAPLAVASTIVGCTGGEPRLLREGAVPRGEVERVLGRALA